MLQSHDFPPPNSRPILMSSRERWIIYPLLFMALAYGWKANVMPPEEVKCRKLVCGDLTAVRATVGSLESTRASAVELETARSVTGQLLVQQDEMKQLELLSTNVGGVIHLHRREPGPSPVAIHVIDERGKVQLLGGLFRHPPQEKPKDEKPTDEKDKEEKPKSP